MWAETTPSGVLPHERCLLGGAITRAGTFAMFGGCGSGGYGPCPASDAWVRKLDGAGGAKWKVRGRDCHLVLAPTNSPTNSSQHLVCWVPCVDVLWLPSRVCALLSSGCCRDAGARLLNVLPRPPPVIHAHPRTHTRTHTGAWQEQSTCISARLWSSVVLAPGGIGAGESVVVFGGKGRFGSGEAGEVGLWNTAQDTWVRLAVKVRGWPAPHSGCASCTTTRSVHKLGV